MPAAMATSSAPPLWYSGCHASSQPMKIVIVILGILIATFGGVITYRALYIEPRTAVLVTNTEVKELPNYKKVVGGSLLFVSGAVIAFLAARRISKV